MPQIDVSKYKKKKNTAIPSSDDRQGFDLIGFFNKDISFGNGQLSDRKKEEFYLEFSTLLLSGVDLKTAFDLLLLDHKDNKDGKTFQTIKDAVLQGESLSEAIQKNGRFSSYEFYSIRIGEETGKLGEVMKELGSFYKSKISQKRKIISALTYPAIVMTTSLGAVFFMLKFVVPMFADVFSRFGGELPAITAFILHVSQFLDRTFWWGVLILLAIFIFFYVNRKKTWWRKWSSTLQLRLPLFGDIIRKIHLARFANTMRLLVSTNTPLLQSIQLVQQMTDFYPIAQSLQETEKFILQGESLHASLARFTFYPAKLVQLIRVGEEVNRLDFFFEKIATQLTEEVEYKTSTLSSLLEPFIIIFLGLVVGLILIAMYLPMFQMSNSF
ncbi:type II secretion system F family protein [Sphingobacterium sp. SRCM116780]|uniref:type II secretion system F family protein n=1 Tax=Sphingobacterium sp. SRCM116780 TaxID=2907623 RepID=UPI001F305613|nr:type II secretion system F family protein [Sphingobacterium sp. SRCM116780]UIR54619.1 type II secretion system F family protein [Sphingobacterium sp. SRCM116780]